MSDVIMGSVIAAASALLGIAVGGYFTAHNQKRERQQRRIGDQLAGFYSPMLGLRAQVLAKSELRLKISGAADAVWRATMEHAYKVGVEHVREIHEERFPLFEKIIQYDNRQLAEDIIPTYAKMVDLFTAQMHLAEFSTLQHFAVLLEFVEIWNRWLDKSLPGEVLAQLNHSEQKLYPFYEDLANNFARMQRALREKRHWWHRSATAVKVLPSH